MDNEQSVQLRQEHDLSAVYSFINAFQEIAHRTNLYSTGWRRVVESLKETGVKVAGFQITMRLTAICI